MVKNMPVGVDDFADVIGNDYYFVDKTRFIKMILDKQVKVTLITRPRRFGKTLNLSMLYYFFTQKNSTENRKLFAGLEIMRADEKYIREQGTRPVIFLTFKDIKYKNWPGELGTIVNLMSELYQQYLYLADSAALSKYDKDYFDNICKKTASQADLEESLAKLCKFLTVHYDRKPILLLDEYDAPIISAWHNNYYDDCIQFMRRFLGTALKNNINLDFAVLTGITRVSKESIFSGLNNLSVCGVLSELYDDCFGFTPDETKKLMRESGYAGKVSELKQWYDGYKFGNTEIYNPWSVINFVYHNCKYRAYWINVSDNAILHTMLQGVDSRRRKELESLLYGQTIETTVDENIVYSDLGGSRDSLYMVLLHTGYLKAVNVKEYKDGIAFVSLKIPNREIHFAYRKEILRHIVPGQGVTLLQEMLDAMTDGRAKDFSEKLSKVLLDSVSYNDVAKKPENFYHGLLLGLSVLLSDEYRIESNRESGYGRFDIAFFPRGNDMAGVILEIKAANSDNELVKLARTAADQIEQKKYQRELECEGVRNIWKYGIALYGKKVEIFMAES